MFKPLLCTELLGFKLERSIFDGVPNFWKLEFNGLSFDMSYNNQKFSRDRFSYSSRKNLNFHNMNLMFYNNQQFLHASMMI